MVGMAWALLLYQPWRDLPFDTLNFAELIPLLRAHDSLLSRFVALTEYHAREQGRIALLVYAGTAAKWSLFGAHPVGWQLSRFALMCAVVAGAYLLLRRLGNGGGASAAGAALFVCASSTHEAWVRLIMGEPLGTALLIGAALLATRYQEARRWRALAVAIALLLVGVLFTKEVMVAAIPFVLLVGWCRQPSGLLARPRLTRRNVWLAAAVAALVIPALAVIAVVAMHAPAQGFSSSYRTGALSAGRLAMNLFTAGAPVLPVFPPFLANLAIALFLYLGVVAIGVRVALERREEREHAALVLAAAASLLLLGATAYMPWPYFQRYYALPLLLAPAMLVALAVDALRRAGKGTAVAAYAAVAALCLALSAQARWYAADAAARQRLNAGLVRQLAARPGADSLLVASRRELAFAWLGTGPILQRYAAAVGTGELPPAADISCARGDSLARAGTAAALLVSYAGDCDLATPAPVVLSQRFRYIHTPSLRLRTDSVQASIYPPEPRR
ncbi:MAG TPA: hypothetical protein VFS05_05120 [Gemmatimonadaceae bacterium]|nr:hypothetical protein [Gemmatimonadaceae bacterium]